ncbi:glutamine amidotransferase [bacterium]
MNLDFASINLLVLFLAIILIVLLMFLYYQAYSRRNKMLLILRILLLFILGVIFLRPKVILFEEPKLQKVIAVLVDCSNSMNAKARESRFLEVKKFIQGSELEHLSQKYELVYYMFHKKIEKYSKKEILAFKQAKPNSTRIISSLEAVIKDMQDERLSAVYLISDGRENVSSYMDNALKKIKAPVYTIGFTQHDDKEKDISIIKKASLNRLFTNVPAVLEADVFGYNLAGKKVNVYLKLHKKILKVKTIHFKKDFEEIPVKFEIVPKTKARILYKIETDKLDGELTYDNNYCIMPMDVQKNKIRVLYLSGGPSREYRFLREVLKSNPIIELVSFIILRRLDNIQPISERELSLIPFPAEEIFKKEIFNFDIVILENFAYQGIFKQSHLNNIKRLVQDYGKSLLIIGGENSFSKNYSYTVFENLLPVTFKKNNERISYGNFKMQVTDNTHPIMLLDDNIDESIRLWNDMPEMEGFITLKAKKDANVIAVHPILADDEGVNYPIIVEWKKDKGVVLCLTNNTTWRWSFNKTKVGSTNYYQKFWLNVMSYLAQPQKYENVSLEIDNFAPDVGSSLGIRLYIDQNRLKEYDGSNILVSIRITAPLGNSYTYSGTIRDITRKTMMYQMYFNPEQAGRYNLYAKIFYKDKLISTKHTYFDAEVPKGERKNVLTNNKFLSKISEATNGRFFFMDEITKESIMPLKIREEKFKIKEIKKILDKPYLLIIILIIFMIELFIRRRKGMI